jgi:hypothetical protein
MQRERKERWFELCELAAVEEDPDKLVELVREINRLLEEKRQRLQQRRSMSGPGSTG